MNSGREIEIGKAADPLALEVDVDYWLSDTLYAFDAGTGWKVVHFTWGAGGGGGVSHRLASPLP